MAKSGVDGGPLAAFRAAWVSGHLDWMRASEALEVARRVAGAAYGEAARAAEAEVARAVERLAQVEVTLVIQFDRFCGIREAASSTSPQSRD
jgi:hypothetical protein